MAEMKIRQRSAPALIALVAIALGGVAACGKKASTPTEGFKIFYEAAKKKDAAAMKKTLSKRLLTDLEGQAKQMNKSFDEFLVSVTVPSTLETSDEKIEGDKASLRVKWQGDSWRTIKFVKEDDEWKVDN
jgi:hypothetical protein